MPTTRPTVIDQLTSLSEEAIERLAHSPLTTRALEAGMQVKTRVEKLVASLADLDGRVTRIESRLDALEQEKASTTRKTRTAATPKPPAEAPADEPADES